MNNIHTKTIDELHCIESLISSARFMQDEDSALFDTLIEAAHQKLTDIIKLNEEASNKQ